jgi:drug/metabolite transporter (DMT)-like permease
MIESLTSHFQMKRGSAILRYHTLASANPEQVKSPATTHLLTKQRARAFFVTARERKMLSVSGGRTPMTITNDKRVSSAKALLLMGLAFSVLWASAFSAGKVALADCPPLALLALRFLAAGVLLAAWAKISGRWYALNGRAVWALVMLGVFNHALYLGLSYSAMTLVPSGLAALLISSNPVLVCALAALFLGERMTLRKAIGLFCGVVGVALVVRSRLGGGADITGVTLILGALLSLTVGTLLYKRLPQTIPMAQAIAVQLLSGGLLVGAASASWEHWDGIEPTLSLAVSLAYLIGPVSIGSYALWFMLLERGSASAASAWHFLVPPVGLFLGWLVLGEPLQAMDLLGALPVAVAIALVTMAAPSRPSVRPAAPSGPGVRPLASDDDFDIAGRCKIRE